MQLWYCAFSLSLGFKGAWLLCPDGGRQAQRGRGQGAGSEGAGPACRFREGGVSVQSLELGRWMLEEGEGLGAGLDPGVPLWSLCPMGEVTWVPVSATFMLSAQGRSLTSLCLHLPFRKPGVMSSPQLGSLQRFNALLWDSVWPRGGAQKSISIRAFRDPVLSPSW